MDRAQVFASIGRSFRAAFVSLAPSPALGPRFADRLLGRYAGWRWLRDAIWWILAFAAFWINVASIDDWLQGPTVVLVFVSAWIALPVGLLGRYSLVGWRMATLAGFLALVLGPSADSTSPWPWPVMLSMVWLATVLVVSARHDRSTVAWVGAVTLAVLAMGIDESANLVWIVLSALALLFGDLVRSRRMASRELERQTEVSALEKARRTVLEERARIARDLHDVVAHHMSMVVVQAESAPYRLADLSDETRVEFASISGSAREALVEVRGLLGVLRNDDGAAAATTPQPGLDEIAELVDGAVRAGVPVTLTVSGDPRPVRPAVGLSAYRIVQESLANASRHAPGAEVRVEVGYDADAVRLRVCNVSAPDAAPPGPPGHGITGMRERATVVGGTLTAEPRDGGGFDVSARLPFTTEPA